MASIFEVETIITKWSPPFDKQVRTDVFNVEKGKSFDIEDALRNDVFTFVESEGNSVIMKYDPRFVPKKGIFKGNSDIVAPQTIRLHLGKPVEFSFMWGNFGVTKKITYQGVGANETADAEDTTETENQEQNTE